MLCSTITLNKTAPITLNIGEIAPSPSPQVHNLGLIIDPTLSFDAHVSSIVKISFFHFRNIVKLRHCLSPPAAESLIPALISTRLDYCNCLLTGISSCSLNKLQLVQNRVARLLTNARSWHHITSVLQTLHWLPIKQRIHKAKSFYLPTKSSTALLHPICPTSLSTTHTPSNLPPAYSTSFYPTSAVLATGPSHVLHPPSGTPFLNLLRDFLSLSIFKTHLKTYLFSQAYNSPLHYITL